MNQKVRSRPVALAEDHSEWLMDFMKKVYEEAFIHGYKHGFDDGYECKENE